MTDANDAATADSNRVAAADSSHMPAAGQNGVTADLAVAVRDLTVRYDRVVALEDVSFVLESGQALGIVGPNGSGKSTLLKTIAGLVEPAAGRVDVFGLTPHALPPGTIAYVPQIEAVDWNFPANVYDVVAMGRNGQNVNGLLRDRDRNFVAGHVRCLIDRVASRPCCRCR